MIEWLDDLSDPRLAPYRELKERDLAREQNLFIAEGEMLVKRLLESRFETDSVLLSEKRLVEIGPLVPESVPTYVLPGEQVNQVLGYKFHSGVMAAGRRPGAGSLDETVPRDGRVMLVICPELANAENLGSLIRISAGFGATAMILGERSCDPFLRQSVRVSMGTVFRLPIVRSKDLKRDLKRLGDEFEVKLLATVLDAPAEPLRGTRRPARMGILFGNEAQGLGDEWTTSCNQRVTIPMKLGTDSLNVAVAAGIFLYHFTD